LTKRVAILQSNYLPWKGYFDLLASVDEFIFLDNVQYTKRDWRNRNLVKTPRGCQWITIPVKSKGAYTQLISDCELVESDWRVKHWRVIEQNYRGSAYFHSEAMFIESLVKGEESDRLSVLNQNTIRKIAERLDINTTIKSSTDYRSEGVSSHRLLSLCMLSNATTYVTGPSARGYLDEPLLSSAGIRVEWFNYENYVTYPQVHGEFKHEVSIVDLILNAGSGSFHDLRRRSQ